MTRWRSRARRLKAVPLLRIDEPRAAYVGWLGYANLGDEAVYDAYRQAFEGLHVTAVPFGGRIVDGLRWVRGRPLFRAIMLGGGTLIGTNAFRLELSRPGLGDALPLYMLGTGVEDPTYEAPYARDFAAELRRWLPILRRAFRVTVRGPRSAEILDSIGVPSTVVGDPALLLTADPPVDRRGGVVGVNVGAARHIYGQDPERVMASVADALNHLPPDIEIRLFSVWPSDDDSVAELASRLSRPASFIAEYRDAVTLMRHLATCDAVIGLKLHFVVLAAAAGVPGLMLAYHPKCLDFQASIGRGRWSLRTDEVSSRRISDDLAELLSDVSGHRRAIAGAVATRRAQLRAEADACLRHLAGGS